MEALIEFQDADQVRLAASKGPKSLADSDIQILRCRPSQEVWNFEAKEEKSKIYVSNLSTTIEKRNLRVAFEKVPVHVTCLFRFYIIGFCCTNT